MNPENRLEVIKSYYHIRPAIWRTMITYNRVHEATLITNYFKENNLSLKDLKVVDFGCGVGDYGIIMLREGAEVIFYDFWEFVDFAEYRCLIEGLKNYKIIKAEENYDAIFKNQDMIIFEEVLDHLENPSEVLTKCLEHDITYIFTTSYPYITDETRFKKSGHSESALECQDEFAEELETYYDCQKFDGEYRLWIKK